MKDDFKAKKPGKSSGGFQTLGLSPPVYRGVMNMGYKVPTPIQRKSFPMILSGKDVVAMARTGSGKTAAFIIPMLEKLKEHSPKIGVRGLILSPTRELALQTLRFTKSLAKFTSVKASLIVGGEGMEQQFAALASNPDILIATPGRLMHHIQEIPDFNLKSIEYVVFDEADRLFEMGFSDQLHEILREIPSSRQTLLFSATLPRILVKFAKAGLNEPEMIRLDVENRMSETLKMAFFTIRSDDKTAAFIHLIRDFIPKDDQTIVFVPTRHHVEFIHELLKVYGVESSCIYGEMDQTSRNINIGKFRANKTKLLIVTDVAARGIDIPLLNNVINYSFPPTAKLFIHRVGRAARAGKCGTAYSFVEPSETPYLVDLHLYIGRRIEDSCPVHTDAYDLDSMQVQDIHYGTLPIELIDRENEHLQQTIKDEFNVSSLAKVCANAMKMYMKTRSDPSKTSIWRCKSLKDQQLHPLFKHQLSEGQASQKAEYLASLQSFRPTQTIFEVASSTNKGLSENKKSSVSSAAIMQQKRKAHMEIIEKNSAKSGKNHDLMDPLQGNDIAEGDLVHNQLSRATVKDRRVSAETTEPKKIAPLSKFARKQLKKRIASGEEEKVVLEELLSQQSQSRTIDTVAQTSKEFVKTEKNETEINAYRDEEFYIDISKKSKDLASESFFSNSFDSGKSHFVGIDPLEASVLDINPDEASAMNKKRRIFHWDTRKKKYIRTNADEVTKSGTLRKRGSTQDYIRTESGVRIKSKKQQAGSMYKKWQQKQHRHIRTGAEEEEGHANVDYRRKTKQKGVRCKDELLSEKKIRKEEDRKMRSRGVKKDPKAAGKKPRMKVRGAPTRSKAIIRKR